MVWIEPRTHTPCVVPQHWSVGSQDDINNDDNDVSNDVNASLRCRVIDDYLSFGCDWSHAMYLVNYIYKFSGNSHDRPVQGRVGQLSSLLIRVVDKLYCSSNGNESSYLLVLSVLDQQFLSSPERERSPFFYQERLFIGRCHPGNDVVGGSVLKT